MSNKYKSQGEKDFQAFLQPQLYFKEVVNLGSP